MNNEKIKVFKIQFQIAEGVTVDGYSAHEKDSKGNYINYLSGRGLAESIAIDHSTTGTNRMAKDLKALLGESFTTGTGQYKNTEGGISNINLWSTTDAAKYYAYYASKGNQKAFAVVIALTSTTLDIIINDKFDRTYVKGDAEKLVWQRVRDQSKITRKEYSNAITYYIKKHSDDLDQVYLDYIFANCTNAQYLHIFNNRCKELRIKWGIEDQELFRDSLSEEELLWLQQIEGVTARWIINDDLEPLAATMKAIKDLQIPKSNRK